MRYISIYNEILLIKPNWLENTSEAYCIAYGNQKESPSNFLVIESKRGHLFQQNAMFTSSIDQFVTELHTV